MISDNSSVDIVGDTHNIDSLKSILLKCDNIISLGDIGAAVPKEIFLNEQLKRYRAAWKAYSKKDSSVDKNDLEWFRNLNVSSWSAQIDNIMDSGKYFVLIRGNSDLAMIDFFPECKDKLIRNINNTFQFIDKVDLITINNVQILLMPFQKIGYDVSETVKKIVASKKLFVLTHCPAFSSARKEYYIHVFNVLKELSKHHDKIICIHGHMHPSNSYTYDIDELPKVKCYCPKAEETFDGFGINNHIIRLNTLSGEFKLIDLVTGKESEFRPLPEKYKHNEDHWNEFDENGNNPNKRV
ncbi:MAG: metallophosphoesterase [Candidatus Woesearchaeota archaeon]